MTRNFIRLLSLWGRPTCQPLSKALDISSATAPDLLKALAILSDTTVGRSAVDWEVLKPYWKSEKRPHSSVGSLKLYQRSYLYDKNSVKHIDQQEWETSTQFSFAMQHEEVYFFFRCLNGITSMGHRPCHGNRTISYCLLVSLLPTWTSVLFCRENRLTSSKL